MQEADSGHAIVASFRFSRFRTEYLDHSYEFQRSETRLDQLLKMADLPGDEAYLQIGFDLAFETLKRAGMRANGGLIGAKLPSGNYVFIPHLCENEE